MKQKKKLGVIGGMGPMATAYFMELVTDMTLADCDAEHIEMDILSIPSIPDRTAYIMHKSDDNPVPAIVAAAKKLEAAGADVIAIPCNTAFCFYEEIAKSVSIPILHPIEETVKYIKSRNYNSAAIMATDGTLFTGLFQKTLENEGMQAVVPGEDEQQLIMQFIYRDVKAGKRVNREEFEEVTRRLKERGAQVIILGCTELSMAKKIGMTHAGFIDTLEVLARAAVEFCAECKPEYEDLIES